jgi:hypothetical protein
MFQATPDIVLHMSAQPIERRSYIDLIETYSANIMASSVN